MIPSDIVEGAEAECPLPRKREELLSNGKKVLYDIHVHTPVNLEVNTYNDNTEASTKDGDTENYGSSYTEASWNIGYKQKKYIERNENGKLEERNSINEYVNFYNRNNKSIAKFLWSSFKKGISKARETIKEKQLK